MIAKFQELMLTRKATAVAMALLVILTGVTFHGVWGHGFVQLDDDSNVYGNEHFVEAPMRNVGVFWSDLKGYEHLWVPLTYTVWAVLAEVASLPEGVFDEKSGTAVAAAFDSTVFHGANFFCHLTATLLCFVILRRLLGGGATVWPAAAGAALFAVHPLHVEPVAWVTGMKDLLSAVFFLLALWAYLRALDGGSEEDRGRSVGIRTLCAEAAISFLVAGAILMLFLKEVLGAGWFGAGALSWFGVEVLRRVRSSRWYGVSALAYLAALFSKPSAMVLPCILFVVAVFLLEVNWRRAAHDLYPWLWAGGILVALTIYSQSGGKYKVELPGFGERIVVALDAYYFYLVKIVAPIGLAVEYGRSPFWLAEQSFHYLSWIVPCVVGAVALWWWYRRGNPRPAIAGVVFALALAPMVGLVKHSYLGISSVADRYAYLALLGVSLFTAGLLKDHAARHWLRWIAVAVIVVLAGLSMRQVAFWRDTDRLYDRTLAINPRSWLITFNKGFAAKTRGRDDEAMDLYMRAAQIWPEYPDAHCNIGMEYLNRGDLASAMAHWRKALQFQEGHPLALLNLAITLTEMGRYEEAVRILQESFERIPYITTRDTAAEVHHFQAYLLANAGKMAEALAPLEKAVGLTGDPEWELELKELRAQLERARTAGAPPSQ